MHVAAVLFDLFDTLLLLEGSEVYYQPSLIKLHEFLIKSGVNASFEDFSRVYFEVRDRFYSESRESLEEPHFRFASCRRCIVSATTLTCRTR